MLTEASDIKRVVVVRMNPGDDVLQSLQAAVRDQKMATGLVLNGVGSLDRYRLHVVGVPSLPTEDVFFEAEGPYDVLSFSGMILDGRVHAHITVSNTEKAIGGHLEEGCRVLTFCIVVLAETPGLNIEDWDTVGAL